ncbi:putative quinol monooxygenase [Shimia sagamensis]|uniref:Quinol monooxygenase YgiN n=1 Tax=Shimia sagamensis TaxID=1566352 RepID=A0ABY1NLC5_9RHOB|nr:putative quinol monooxygenase [Shimia sagamensis]SMP12616.1 Quinol monooxygenase YgiN [Shimia sagamensis]
MIKLTGYIDVPADRLTTVMEALPLHIALTRAETGCLSFEVTEDPTVQGRFLVAERFTNRASFEAHQTRTKASDWATVTDGIPRHYQIEDLTE